MAYQNEVGVELGVLHKDPHEVENVDTAVTIVRLTGNLVYHAVSTDFKRGAVDTNECKLALSWSRLLDAFLVFRLELKVVDEHLFCLRVLASERVEEQDVRATRFVISCKWIQAL